MVDTKTAITPYDRVSDVNVIMTVVHPKPVVGLGNLLILNAVTGNKNTDNSENGSKTQPTGDQTTQPASKEPDIPKGSGQITQPTDEKSDGNQDTKPQGKDDTQKTPVDDAKFQTFNVKSLMSSLAETKTSAQKTLPDSSLNKDRMNGLLKRKTDPKTGAMYREYKNLEAVAVDYPQDTPVWKKASAYFAQDYHSDRVAVLDYDPEQVYESLKAFWYYNWTFAINVDNTISDSSLIQSNIFEANKDHFLVLQTDDLGKYEPYFGQNYTIGLKHDLSEAMDAAFVGAIATRPVGSVTWKLKELHGISTEDLTTQELGGINQTHAIAYVEVFGRGETTEGWTLSGEYIDVLHGVLWVQTQSEAALEDLLQRNGKIPYEQSGINMLLATETNVLEQAYERGIIRTNERTGRGDYKVSATPRDEQPPEGLSKRHYGGLSFEYHVQGAIHTITVNGTVDSDTIMQ